MSDQAGVQARQRLSKKQRAAVDNAAATGSELEGQVSASVEAMRVAAKRGEAAELARLLALDPRPQWRRPRAARPAMHLAARGGGALVAGLLLDHGAPLGLSDALATPLAAAAEAGVEECVEFFLPLVDAWALDRDGVDALGRAMARGHRQCALILCHAPQPAPASRWMSALGLALRQLDEPLALALAAKALQAGACVEDVFSHPVARDPLARLERVDGLCGAELAQARDWLRQRVLARAQRGELARELSLQEAGAPFSKAAPRL